MTRPMTPDERKRLQLKVDGSRAIAKALWAGFGVLVVYRGTYFLTGSGSSIGEITLLMVAAVLPIAVGHATRTISAPYDRDLKGNIVAGVSSEIGPVDGNVIDINGEHFEVPPKIANALAEGDTVAVEFAPHSRMVLQVHRLVQARRTALTAGGDGAVTTE